MNRKSFLFIILGVVVFLAGCQPETTAQSPLSASLSELSGTVDTKQAGEDAFTPASADTVLQVNGQIQTGDDGRVRLDLSSGTLIRVAPSSLFTLTSNEEVDGGLATKIKLEFGKIFIILSGGSADVETPSGVASVRGSYMKVEVDPETLDIFVTCLEGDCSANNPSGGVDFTNGQRVILFHRDPVKGNWTVPNVEPMTPEEFQEWLDENPEAEELFNQAMATVTALAQSTEESPTAPPTLEQAAPPAGSSNACFKIIQPEAGASLPKQGRINFEWEAQPGAQKYIITFVDEFGNHATIETTETSNAYYIEIFPNGGEFSWFVTSYGEDGNEICSTEAITFSKPQGDPTQKPEKEPRPEPESTEPAVTCDPCDYYNESCFNYDACMAQGGG